jgi:hypothetical protein
LRGIDLHGAGYVIQHRRTGVRVTDVSQLRCGRVLSLGGAEERRVTNTNRNQKLAVADGQWSELRS